MVEKENIIELIKKCFALSGSPNEHEAARAMEKAQELLEKYNLSMADVKAASGTDTEMVQRYYDILGRFLWRKALVIYIARQNFCRGFYTGWRDRVLIVGRDVNVEAAIAMVNWILPQVERISRQATRKYKAIYDEWEDKLVSKPSYRDSFCWGVIGRINNRLYQEREVRMEASPDTKALVIDRTTEVERYVEEHMSLGKAKGIQGPRSMKGYSDGREAGDKVALRKSSRIKGG